MKDKNTTTYRILFGLYAVVIIGLFFYSRNMSNRTFVVTDKTKVGYGTAIYMTHECSKEWKETATDGFDRGKEFDFTIVNNTESDIRSWQAEIGFADDFKIDSSWNGDFGKNDYTLSVVPDNNTAELAGGEEKKFGLVMHCREEQEVSDFKLYYNANVRMTDSPLFWIILAAFIITLTVYATDVLNRRKYKNLRQRQEEIQAILLESFTTFANIIDAKDPYTQGHSLRVAEYARLIAGKMGYSEAERERVYWIGMLHDIGKIGITDAILQKPGKLDNEEYTTIKTHVDIGGAILSDFNALPDIADGARYHHERWDGKGYSKHISGKDIPEIARIICVADSFDAMTSPRVYRKAMPTDFAKEELQKCSGTQFDPDIVPVMIELIDEGVVPIEIKETIKWELSE